MKRAGERGIGLVELMVVVAIMSVIGLLAFLMIKGSMDSLDVISGVDKIESGGYKILTTINREIAASAVSTTAVDKSTDTQGDRITYQTPQAPSASNPSALGMDSIIGNWATILVVNMGSTAAPSWSLVRRVSTSANGGGTVVGTDRILASGLDAPGTTKGFVATLTPTANGTYLTVSARFALLNPTDNNKRALTTSVVISN